MYRRLAITLFKCTCRYSSKHNADVAAFLFNQLKEKGFTTPYTDRQMMQLSIAIMNHEDVCSMIVEPNRRESVVKNKRVKYL